MRPRGEPTSSMRKHAASARLMAMSCAPYTGYSTPEDQVTIKRCTSIYVHQREGIAVQTLFTRDASMHSSGWWKNPDYERCEHLSLSFWDAARRTPIGPNRLEAKLWCLAFWTAERCRLLWVEPPYTPVGQQVGVYHYRLFMQPDWATAILPRKEVYTKEFTPAGWKSFSDVHGDNTGMETPP